jgi:hypothetical protein
MHRRGKGPRNAIGALVAALALTMLGLLAGCGGSSGSGSSSGTSSAPGATKTVTVEAEQPLSKAAWIAAADGICTAAKEGDQGSDFDREYREAEEAPESAENREHVANLLREKIDSERPGYEELRALKPPPADAEIVSKILSTAEANLAAGEQLADAIEGNELGKIETVAEQVKETSATAKGLAQGYGLKVCGADD